MEKMAESEDIEVVNLMQIEMLEPIFALEYVRYQRVVKRYLHPNILLHQEQIPFFEVPQEPRAIKNRKK